MVFVVGVFSRMFVDVDVVSVRDVSGSFCLLHPIIKNRNKDDNTNDYL